jgi:SAM-dependent methyltransferase
MNPLGWLVESWKEKGIVQTVKVAGNLVIDLFFDWKYGTDTMRWVHETELDTTSDNKMHSAPYRATKAKPLLNLLRKLDLPRDSTFVDIGSGKGRVLLIASQYGFRKVVGIEFSGRFCEVARKNVELFSRKEKIGSPIEVIQADATKYRFHAEECVLFMYNPFGPVVLSQVMENLGRSLRENPRPLWLIYNTPLHHAVIDKAGIFKSSSFYEIGGNHFRVYRN